MKKKVLIGCILIGLLLSLNPTVFADEVGFALGPVANEKSLIKKTFHEELYFYDFPIFIGGPYVENKLTKHYKYYTDLQIAVHPVNSKQDRVKPVLVYHHQEVRWSPWGRTSPFLGGGLEFIWIYRNYAHNNNYKFYNSTHFYPYLSVGTESKVKDFLIGVTLRSRVGVAKEKLFDGSGELTVELTKKFK